MRLTRFISRVQVILEEAVVVELGEAVGDRELLEHLIGLLQGLVLAQQLLVRLLDLRAVADQAPGHVLEGVREQTDLVVAVRIREVHVEMALRDPSRALGQRLDRLHDRGGDLVGEEAEQQDDAEVDHEDPRDDGEHGLEGLLELWKRTERETGVQIDYGEKVVDITPEDGGFTVTSSSGATRCRAVVLAIGRRGSPRKLGADGEELSKVVYALEDPADHAGERVLVVGAGDSALEAALALSEETDTQVTLSCRGDAFPRAKPANRARLEECERDERVRVVRSSSVSSVDPAAVVLKTPNGEEQIGNDAIIVCIGGELPFGFLREVGVETEVRHGEP